MKIDSEKIVVLGPNGSGKTTLIKSILSLIPYSGKVFIDGVEVRRIRGYIGISTNIAKVYGLGYLVRDLLQLYSRIKGVDRDLALDMLDRLGIRDRVLDKPLSRLSAGENLMVRNVLALASLPKIYVIDEPFENIDMARRGIIARWFAEYASEGILVTHELSMLREKSFQDFKVYFLIAGKLHGPIEVRDLAELCVVEGARSDAVLVINEGGYAVSLIRSGDSCDTKLYMVGSVNKLYGVSL